MLSNCNQIRIACYRLVPGQESTIYFGFEPSNTGLLCVQRILSYPSIDRQSVKKRIFFHSSTGDQTHVTKLHRALLVSLRWN